MKIIALLLLSFSVFFQCAYASPLEVIRDYKKGHGAQIVRDYAHYLTLPNHSGNLSDIEKNATFLKKAFEARGVSIELLRLPGVPPVIYGRLDVEGADRTLALYAHYDGQPVVKENWRHGPWQPTLYTKSLKDGGRARALPQDGEVIDLENRLYARSASDDKAPIMALLALLDAFKAGNITPTSNLIFFFEGEEEEGSRHLKDYLQTYKDKFKEVDMWLFCDGPVHQSRQPQIVLGARGITSLKITTYGPNRPLHSGHYGNWAPVPGTALSHLLASMKDQEGRILIDGFQDTALAPTKAEKAAIAAMPDIESALRKDFGLARSEENNAPLALQYMKPTVTILKLTSGGNGNAIPATATAKIGLRLALGNDAVDIQEKVEKHIEKQGFHIVRDDPDTETRLNYAKIAKVVRAKGYPAARTSLDHPLAQQIIGAMRRANPDPLVVLPSYGGTLPLYLFPEILGQPFVITPMANHDNNQHAPNENIRLKNLWDGMDMFAEILTMP